MGSPFPANATLTFSAAIGSLTTDPRTGARVPGVLTIVVKAYLSPQGRAGVGNPRGKYNPGVDEGEESLSGRFVNPSTVPDGVGHLSKAWAVITDPVTKKTQSGWFTLYRGTPSPLGIEAALGASIAGTFRAQAIAGGTNAPIPQPTPGQYAAATALAVHKLVALVNGQLVYTNASDVTQLDGAIGLTLNAVAAGGKPQLVTSGTVQDPGWNWTANQAVFVGASGNLTQAPLTIAPGYYQQVGLAVSAKQVVLNLEEAYLL